MQKAVRLGVFVVSSLSKEICCSVSFVVGGL
jgi:hypothetical protein